MNPWSLLFISVIAETAGTMFLKASQGLSRPLSTVAMALLYSVAVWLMGLASKRLEIGITYSVWSGAGTALIAAAGVVVFHESISATKVGGLACIVTGLVLLNLGPR